jgi:pyruvate dehydrogenase (quinone)
MAGDTKYEASQNLPPFSYADYAELCGLKGIRLERPEDIGAAWDAALTSDRPCVIDALTDPNVVPLPPHITLKEAKAFGMSLLKGDPQEAGIIQQAIGHLFPSIATKSGNGKG